MSTAMRVKCGSGSPDLDADAHAMVFPPRVAATGRAKELAKVPGVQAGCSSQGGDDETDRRVVQVSFDTVEGNTHNNR